MAAPGATTLGDLRTPAFVVDRTTAANNARRMREQAAALGVALRPHLKTHKVHCAGSGTHGQRGRRRAG